MTVANNHTKNVVFSDMERIKIRVEKGWSRWNKVLLVKLSSKIGSLLIHQHQVTAFSVEKSGWAAPLPLSLALFAPAPSKRQ